MKFFEKKKSSIVYINGIRTTYSDALYDAQLIAPQTKLIWNRTDFDGVYRQDEETLAGAAIAELKYEIISRIKRNKPICICAHSKGCHITLMAIESLFNDYQAGIEKFVHLYMFGGIVLIPTTYGHTVENWMSRGRYKLLDGFAHIGGEYHRVWSRGRFQTWSSILLYSKEKSHYTLRYVDNESLIPWDHHNFRKAYLAIARDKAAQFMSKQAPPSKKFFKNFDRGQLLREKNSN